MSDELPVLDGEVVEDEVDPASSFTPSPPAPTAPVVYVPQRPARPAPGDPALDPSHPDYVQPARVNLRKGRGQVSEAQMDSRAAFFGFPLDLVMAFTPRARARRCSTATREHSTATWSR